VQEMRTTAVQPDTITCTTGVIACGSDSEHWQHALELVQSLRKLNTRYDVVALGASVDVFCNGSVLAWRIALALLSSARHDGLEPNTQ
ncbi:unnamed protein product, partial [Polarella glacialis]